MRKIILSVIAIALCSFALAQSEVPDGNYFLKKKVVVISEGGQYDYDEGKRILKPSGNQGEMIAQAQKTLLSNMVSWYGANVIPEMSSEYSDIKMALSNMSSDADFSNVQKVASSAGIDYVVMSDLTWMMFRDQLFIYEFHIKTLDVANGVIDRWSKNFYINALKDGNGEDATHRMTNGSCDAYKEACTRITPRLYGITNLKKGGKQAEMLSITFAGYYLNDVMYTYKLNGVLKNLDGTDKVFIVADPIAKSTKIKVEDPTYIVDFDGKIELDPTIIASAGSLITSNIPNAEYSFVPIAVEALDNANAKSYENHNRDMANYALFSAIHENRMLKVIANPSQSSTTIKYTCKLSDCTEAKNIAKFKLSIIDNESGSTIKESDIESHTSNFKTAIAACINDVFCATVALNEIGKKDISFVTDKPIAYTEGEKFILSVNNGEKKDIAIYELTSWNGQKYVFSLVKAIDKKLEGKIGKDAFAKYAISKYVELPKDLKKDNSEFKKVAVANKLMDLAGMK